MLKSRMPQYKRKMIVINKLVKNCDACRRDHYFEIDETGTKFVCPNTQKVVEIDGT